GPGPPGGDQGRPFPAPDPQGVRGAGGSAGRRRGRGLGRRPAGAGLGRAHRPLHQHRPGHNHEPAAQARPPAPDRHRDRGRVPSVRSRLPSVSVRLKLTLLYGGLFLLAGAGLLAVNYALVRSQFQLPFGIRIESRGPGLPDALGDAPGLVLMRAEAADGGDQFVAAAPSPEAVAAVRREAEAVRRELQAATLRELLTQSGIALALMSVVSIGLGWLVAGRVLRPLSAITATARRLEGSTLHERINLQGPQDELKELADTFDQMLGRLDAAFETQRRFVANASHELRTPLAIARTEVDVALADPATGRAELRAMAERVLEAQQRGAGPCAPAPGGGARSGRPSRSPWPGPPPTPLSWPLPRSSGSACGSAGC